MPAYSNRELHEILVLLNTMNGTQCMQKWWKLTAISKILSRKLENKQTNWCLNVNISVTKHNEWHTMHAEAMKINCHF